MLAFLVCLAALGFWSMVGYGFLSTFAARRNATPHFLLAPAVGLALTVCSLFVANRAGLPIRIAGWPVSLGLLLLAAAGLWRRRPPLPARRLAPFAGLAVLSVLLIGWPLFKFGFDWVSFANDDLANYSLYSKCLLDHGWNDPVEAADLAEGREGSRAFVFLYSMTGYRPGAEILMAWLASLTGKSPLATAMPLALAMNASLVLASGGLVYRGRSRWLAALAACTLVALSAPLSLGVLNQLMGQAGGLAVFCAAVALLCRPMRLRKWAHLARRSVLLGAVLAGVVICYCELVPFLVLAYALYAGVSLWRKRWRWRPALAAPAGAALVVLAVMQDYLPRAAGFVLIQAAQGTRVKQSLMELFPYYLHPSGLASLWGFQPFFQNLPEPWLSAAILAGIGLLLVVSLLAVRLAWRAQPVAVVCGVLLAVAAILCLQGSAFGLFKLVMYCQPFLLGTLALGWARLGRWRWVAVAPLLAIALGSARTQHFYASQSFGSSGLCELKSASEDAVFRRLHTQLRKCDADYVVVTTESSFATKFVAMHNDGRPLRTPVYPFLSALSHSLRNPLVPRAEAERIASLSDSIMDHFPEWEFPLHDPADPGRTNRFVSVAPTGHKPARPAAVLASGRLSVLNRHHYPEATTSGFYVRPLSDVRDYLLLVDSHLGHQYFMALGSPDVAAFQLEADFYYPARTMVSLGRDLLFEVLNPSPRCRVLVELTTTLAANGDCRLPDAAVIGERRAKLPLTGRGAARVIAEPVEPQVIADNRYLGLDLGERKFQFQSRPSRWDKLASAVQMDRRRLTSFARDVSLLSEQEYAALKPPANLSKFPEDLIHPDLEFSGIYEDGWLSEHAWFRPASGASEADLVIEVMVPAIEGSAFRTTLTVLVDGEPVCRRELAVGQFALRQTLSGLSARPKVELIFSHSQRLPGEDTRVVGGQLRLLGFEPVQTAKAE